MPDTISLDSKDITPIDITSALPVRTIKIVSIADAATYHKVSEKAIYAAIRKGKLQRVNGIPEHQLDSYKPDRLNQSRGRKRLEQAK